MDSSTGPQPPKRQKLPLDHEEAGDLTSPPPPDMLTSSFPRSTDFNFNQLVPTPPLLTPSLFSNHYETINECRPPKGRLRDSIGDGRGLSLSLSSDRRCANRHLDERPVSYETNAVGHEAWRISVPLGPFTGYASILNRSRFLKPAQDLLDELCGVDSRVFAPNYPLQNFCDDGVSEMDPIHSNDTASKTCKESSLFLLLDEVFRRYKQYYLHLQSVVASFEAVRGIGNAAPYISFALRSMAHQFSSLKKTLFERTQIAGEAMGCTSISSVALRCQDLNVICANLKPVLTSPATEHPVWRSQRGLPAYAVAVFKNWLFEHFLHPYPSDTDKNLLAQQTGLSRNQVSNWFINARVRLWKPLVEEIHTLDKQRGQPALNHGPKISKETAIHQPPDTHPGEARSLRKQCQNSFNPSWSESLIDYYSTSAMQHRKPDENMHISLALGLEQNDVSGNSAHRNDVHM